MSACTRLAVSFAAGALLAPASVAHAQLTDLQPGPNFTSENQFGTNFSENIDPGDCDNDGDLDVLVANGGISGPQPDRIFINNGGLQGGTVGTFTEETATRFAGAPADMSLDCEFVDYDNDGDLDVAIANRGFISNGGEVSRFYTNNGGLQAGTIGFYTEETNARWGTLVGVPLGQQVFGGNAGPFRDYSCDCDFADLDDNGSSDLFFSSYGPEIDGTLDSRIFLNDGTGIFNELWPWANATADTKTHTLDMDLADMDGDFDMDVVMSSRNSQARTYMNNLYNGMSASPFEDITQTAFIATGATLSGQNNYEGEYGDVDGDGDFDLWMGNYDHDFERVLVNRGFVAGVGFSFTKKANWLKGDSNVDEQECDFGDFDNDGDLDAYVANFTGTSSLYQSGLAQGLDPETQGLFHNTGVAGAGNLATAFDENTGSWNLGTELDGDWADVDNDGDEDILVANDQGQQNRLVRNVFGVPDTHAPAFYKVEQAADKPNGSSTVIHAAIRDNSSYYLTNFYPTVLKYRVNNGVEQSITMFHQGSMQFRGVVPAQTDGLVQYHVECTDLAGNVGISAELCYEQGAPPGFGTWTDLGFGLAGAAGIPQLTGTGVQLGGCPIEIDLANAAPSSLAVLFVSLSGTPAPFKGGTLVPMPLLLTEVFPSTGPSGAIMVPVIWPSGLPPAFSIYYQYGVQDAGAPVGVALSNALRSTTP